jgi:DNA-binding NarL/FixJ family response regulator
VTTTILIADDHRLFRQGLAALLREQPDWEVVAEAGSAEDAVQLAATLRPQVALLDVEMPRMGGIEAARQIRALSSGTVIVALSMYSDAHYQERMRHAGAAAYVLKNEAIDQLVEAIRAALRGERVSSPAVVRCEGMPAARSAQLATQELSAREREVLRMLAQGLRTKTIAEALDISPKTVETYRARLMNKLDIDNVSGLVRFAIRAGLVSPEA